MRSLILSFALGAVSLLGLLTIAPPQAEAQIIWRRARPYYYSSYYTPGYVYSYRYAYPSYSYYWSYPGYSAFYPSYGAYHWPGYSTYYSSGYSTYYAPGGYYGYYWGY
jgi:hypothetical protein